MIERWLENFIFHSRWLLAPIYIGLSASLLILVLSVRPGTLRVARIG